MQVLYSVRFRVSAACRGVFGDTCTLQRVQEELLGYSDFGLHRFALSQGARFADFLLDPEHLMDSAKCRTLSELLPKLRVGYPSLPQPDMLVRDALRSIAAMKWPKELTAVLSCPNSCQG